MRLTRLAPVLDGIADVQVYGNDDLVRDHGEVLLFAVDLDCVLLEDPMLSVFEVGVKNASSRRGKRLESARKTPRSGCWTKRCFPNWETGTGTILFLSPENLVFRFVPFGLTPSTLNR